MKKLLLFIAIYLTGCGPSKEEKERQARLGKPSNSATVLSSHASGISVIEIDHCEYVYCEVVYGVAIVHKANCKNH